MSQHLPTPFLLTTEKPNVIIILWESLTWKAVNLKHKGNEVLPVFNGLTKSGVYFNNIYASGDRTEKGLAAALSAYPAQPITTIIKDSKKAMSLPVLSADFKKISYATDFYYGGDIEFANMKAYLMNASFDHISHEGEYDASQLNSKWGAHDQFVFDKYLADHKEKTEPFFSFIMTLSSHEPFETPVEVAIEGRDELSLFPSIHYIIQTNVWGNFWIKQV